MWTNHRVLTFFGSRDTKKYSGDSYQTISLGDIFAMEPQSEEKEDAAAFIPSTYNAFDGRSHDAQQDRGEFVALTIDVDSGNLSIEVMRDTLQKYAGESAILIYSSSSAKPDNKKWRGIIPLEKHVSFELWEDLQLSMYEFFWQETKIKPDMALARSGQPVYLPNVPNHRRDAIGDPEFYQSLVIEGHGLTPSCGMVKQLLMAYRKRQQEHEAQQAKIREEAKAQMEARRAKFAGQSTANMIDAFNQANSVESMLMANGYERKGRSDSWRSPYQTTSSFATKNFGEYWVSMSDSDAKAGIGKLKSGRANAYCFGDAFDIFCHFEHGGDIKSAIKALAAEAKADQRKDMTRFEPRMSAIDEFGVIEQPASEVTLISDEADDAVFEPSNASEIIEHVASIKMPDPLMTDDTVLREVMERMDSVEDLNELMVEVPKWVAEKKCLDSFACEMLAGHYKKNMKRLGATISIKSCRDLMQTKELINYQRDVVKAEQAKFASQVDSNEMLRDWVYLTKHNSFFNLRDGREIDSKAFDIIYASSVPVLPGEDRPQTATRFFAFSDGRSVYHQMYVPSLWSDVPGGQFFKHENIDYLNSYMGNKLPDHSKDWETRKHWQVVKNHIYHLMSCDAEASMMIDWMAHNVQKPGVKILWAPVILGPQGAGKTTIERIMSAVMGQQNVRTIALDEIYSAFTGWAEGACVRFIEEIRIAGHSRHDVMNKLKPYLTNERVTVVRKGRDGVDVLNTQNYACFTNHEDAIVVDKEDRRYGVFRTKAATREDVEKMFDDVYWKTLYNVINNHAADIRGWLMDVDLSQFNRVAAPPMTDAKLKMIEATRAEDEVNTEIVLQDGAPGVTEDVVSTSHLNNALKAAGFRTMMGSRIHKILASLGFVRLDWTIKFDGKNLRFHVRKSWLEGTGLDQVEDRSRINERIREVINKSLFDNDSF